MSDGMTFIYKAYLLKHVSPGSLVVPSSGIRPYPVAVEHKGVRWGCRTTPLRYPPGAAYDKVLLQQQVKTMKQLLVYSTGKNIQQQSL